MVKLYTSHSDPSTLAILITSLSVGIPKLDCIITGALPTKILAENAEAFHVALPLLNIDRKNNISTSNAILLYLASLQEKLQLVNGVETMQFLDLVAQTDDAAFVAAILEGIQGQDPSVHLEQRDGWTLADVAVYARLKALHKQRASGAVWQALEAGQLEALEQWMLHLSKDKSFVEGESRFKGLLDEAVTQTTAALNSGKLWELSKEEQIGALDILVAHYKEQLVLVEEKDRQKRAKFAETQEGQEAELSRSASSDAEAYKKAIAVYEQSLTALRS